MIKLVQCVRRRPELSVEEFREAWEAYGERLRALAIELGALRATISTALETPINEQLVAARDIAPPVDGVAEVVWRSGAQALCDADRPATRARIGDLWELQATFADLPASSFFFAHELELLDAGS